MAGIGHGQRLGPLRHDIAGKDRRQPFIIKAGHIEKEFVGQPAIESDEARRLHRRRQHGGAEAFRQAGIGIVEFHHG
ncbi:hypothetical protein D3C78_1046250 [compost metagenome]